MIAIKDMESPVVVTSDSIDLNSVVVIIPALNEQRSMPLVLGDIPKIGRVIVADNGSTDRAANVAATGGATVVSEPQRGYGVACLRGLNCEVTLMRDRDRKYTNAFAIGVALADRLDDSLLRPSPIHCQF